MYGAKILEMTMHVVVIKSVAHEAKTKTHADGIGTWWEEQGKGER